MKSIKDLNAEIAELKKVYDAAYEVYLEAHSAYDKAERELRNRKEERDRVRRANCKHTTLVKEWQRRFEGEGFVDTEYSVCKKCGEVFHVRDVNIVLKSEK